MTDDEIAADLARLREPAQRAQHAAWLAGRPASVRKLAAAYPLDLVYVITDDAPYAVTVPGCLVAIRSYFENGEVRILVLRGPPDLPPNLVTVVDPRYLAPNIELPPIVATGRL